ncbi:hypothetical protein CPSG_03587 [Coccidioides posadasii str. Silveira]|uniref:Uncharacterized protein n=1 Tax=Coccidioides posadasii (strain RMSCC 757 / Silveira) TaxID=443226 RepID=E9D0F9_COCPS|nr:hypothetical protein CPSG_03587 [Coccidioides posadasii str. Silveira]
MCRICSRCSMLSMTCLRGTPDPACLNWSASTKYVVEADQLFRRAGSMHPYSFLQKRGCKLLQSRYPAVLREVSSTLAMASKVCACSRGAWWQPSPSPPGSSLAMAIRMATTATKQNLHKKGDPTWPSQFLIHT